MENLEGMIRDILNFVNKIETPYLSSVDMDTSSSDISSIDVVDMISGREFTLFTIPMSIVSECKCPRCVSKRNITSYADKTLELIQDILIQADRKPRRKPDVEVDPEMAKRVKLNADLQAAINIEDYEEALLIKEEIDRFEKLLKNTKEKS